MSTLRHASILSLLLAGSCHEGTKSTRDPDAAQDFSASITINVDRPGPPASRMIVGTNVQWVDGADELAAGWAFGGSESVLAGTGPDAAAGVVLRPGLAAMTPDLLKAIDALRPGALRFPGGTNADVYHWRGGVGPLDQRGTGQHVFRKQQQRMLFGTAEFLALADRVDAEPVITVNVPSGTAEEAAAWVRAVNISGLANPDNALATNATVSLELPPGTARRVHFWEIGNEPYLREDLRPELTLAPTEFAKRATAFIEAMKAVDPSIKVGLPIRLDRLGAAPLVHFPGFANLVLKEVSAPIDFLALHNAYLPLVYKGGPGGAKPDDEALFRTTMASSRVVEADFEAVRSFWRQLRPAQPLAMAVTEYSAMFTLGGALDQYASSLGAALFLADVLRVFAGTPELKLAAQWSLNGNGIFGALTTKGIPRPTYEVMRAYSRTLTGLMLPVSVDGPTFDSPAIGVVPTYRGTPLISALVTSDTTFSDSNTVGLIAEIAAGSPVDASRARGGRRIRMLIQNKDFYRRAAISITAASDAVKPDTADGFLGADQLFAETLSPPAGTSAFSVRELPLKKDRWRSIDIVKARRGVLTLTLPAQSLTYVELTIRKDAAISR